MEANAEQAADYYAQAAKKGCASARRHLALCYFSGLGVEKDPVRAVALLRQAAEQNDAGAVFELARCYQSGRGVSRNRAEAQELFQRAFKMCIRDRLFAD